MRLLNMNTPLLISPAGRVRSCTFVSLAAVDWVDVTKRQLLDSDSVHVLSSAFGIGRDIVLDDDRGLIPTLSAAFWTTILTFRSSSSEGGMSRMIFRNPRSR